MEERSLYYDGPLIQRKERVHALDTEFRRYNVRADFGQMTRRYGRLVVGGASVWSAPTHRARGFSLVFPTAQLYASGFGVEGIVGVGMVVCVHAA